MAVAASPAFAANCTQPSSPAPINVTGAATPITCTNTDPRTATVAGDNAIGIATTGNGNTIDIHNSGLLTTNSSSLIPPPIGGGFSQSTGARGIYAGTNGVGADITIDNTATINSYSDGIKATDAATSGPVLSSGTHISITNSGALTTGVNSEGIFGRASYGSGNSVTIDNSGAIETGYSASFSGTSSGITANVGGDDGNVSVTNSGTITTSGVTAAGISAIASYYNGSGSSIVVDNKAGGTITASGADAYGIFAQAGSVSPSNAPPNPDTGGTVQITNAASVSAGYIGIGGFTYGAGGNITIDNSGNVTAGSGGYTGSDGVKAVANGGNSTITITNSGAIDTTAGGANSRGIEAINGPLFTGGALAISITNTGAITTGQDSEGIFARSAGAGSSVTIDNSGAIVTGYSASTSGGSSGIFADVDGGDDGSVSVTNSGTITTSGVTAAGISAIASYYNGSGSSIVVDNKAGGTITTTGADAYGIFAQAGSVAPFNSPPNPDTGGTVQITNAASVSAGYIGIGAFTYGAGGNITIANSGAITSGTGAAAGSDGIDALANGGNSTITITNHGAIDTTAGGADSRGINAINGPLFAGANLAISVTNTGAITTGADSEGIFARSAGAGSSVTIDNSGAILTGASASTSGGSSGIFADVDGAGNGSVSVANSGAITTSGVTAAGISAIANYYSGSGGSIVVDNKAGGTITTTGADAYGIFAQAGSVAPFNAPPNPDTGGTVQITNAASVTAAYIGIGAFTYGAGGDITVTNSGAVHSTASEGLVAKANGGNSTIVITNSGDIYGALAGIEADSTGGSTINIAEGGSVGAANFLAITSTAGAAQINNSGVIDGAVALSDAGNTFNNNDKGVFRAYTDSSFGAGADTLTNTGVIDASGDHFTAAATSIHFNGLETLVNGSLGSGPGLITLEDGKTGDALTTSGNFVGQGNSKLGVDVNLLTGAADTLTIGGNTSGHTGIDVNLIGGPTGSPESTFIPIVYVTGTTAAGDFALAKPLNAGFFAYDLALEGHVHGLQFVGLDNAAFELPAGVTGAQDLWQDGAGFWQDHMADLRAQVADLSSEGRGLHYADADAVVSTPGLHAGGVWLRAVGDWSNRDQNVTYHAPVTQASYTLNLDRSQNTGAFMGGFDMGVNGAAGGDLLFGVMGGYVTSNLDFKATHDHWDYRGGTVGGYANYLRGGFYLDGLLKADILTIDIEDHQGGLGYKASTHATNIGVRLDAGYRARMGWGFVEPQAGLQWVHTQMDSTTLFGDDVAFKDGSSGLARFGVRVGTDMPMRGVTVTPDLTLSVWDRFGNSNRTTIDFPATSFSATDNAGAGVYGEVGVGVTVASARNWSGEVRGSYRYGDKYDSSTASAALRYSW